MVHGVDCHLFLRNYKRGRDGEKRMEALHDLLRSKEMRFRLSSCVE